MHHTWYPGAERASCGILLAEAQMPATTYDPSVKCVNCKTYLRSYHEHFPKAHEFKNEGGRR